MDWDKKIYPVDIIKYIFKPFKIILEPIRETWIYLKLGFKEVFQFRVKSYSTPKKDVDELWKNIENHEYVKEYAKETHRLLGRPLVPSNQEILNRKTKRLLDGKRRPIKPPPPPTPPAKRKEYSPEAKRLMKVLEDADKNMKKRFEDMDDDLDKLWKRLEKRIDEML